MNPGYVSAMANHLWQSTLFAGLAGLLTLALRNNRARVRHGVWLAASCKFLIPLSVLIAWGGQIRWRAVPETAQSNIAIVMDQVSQPFPTPSISARPVAPLHAGLLPEILLAGWALGFLGISGAWWIRWRRIRDAVHTGSPLRLEIPIRAISSPTLLEPGVFGVFRPVLMLPESMFDRLTPPQVEAIIAHELCHVRHKDNLVAALHMFVETVFWFHPLLWWVGKRIVEERERACDEEVLRLGSEPRVYAEGILNVCKLYVEAPLVCISGITGADLKKRIHQIVSAGAVRQLSWRRKFLLAAAGVAALAWPLAVGILNAPAGRAQSADTAPLKFEVASVKPNKSGSQRSTSWILPGGRFTATNNTVRALVLNAYNQIPPYLLSGGPSWIDSEAYDVEAKPADSAIPPGLRGRPLWDKTRTMLRALLADRFHLEIRTVSKEMPLYEISVAKNGPKLTKSTYDCSAEVDSCHGFRGNPRRLSAMGVDMADLASILSGYAGRPVLDKTGISGVFDFLLQWNVFYGRQRPTQTTDETPRPPSREEGPMPEADSLPDLATALDQQLGLKLESRKGPVYTYVIERVERPSEN